MWGTTYISTKVLLEAFHPVEILIFRFVLAWAILFLCAPRPQLPRSFRSELPFLGAAQQQGLNDLLVTRKVFFWGVLFTLPFCLGTGITFDLTRFAQPVMLGNTVYLGIVASALCFLAWNRASALIGPVATNVYLYLMPVITVAASFFILGEPVTLFTLGAIVLILARLWLSQRRSTTLATL